MFISLADAQGTWVVFYEDPKYNPRKVVCWAIKEYANNSRKIVPIVHGGGGKLVDANSVSKIGALLSGKSAQEKLTGAEDNMPPEPVVASAPDPVPELEYGDDE